MSAPRKSLTTVFFFFFFFLRRVKSVLPPVPPWSLYTYTYMYAYSPIYVYNLTFCPGLANVRLLGRA